jgi:hypothetical protein
VRLAVLSDVGPGRLESTADLLKLVLWRLGRFAGLSKSTLGILASLPPPR